MKAKITVAIGAGALSCVALTGCGGGNGTVYFVPPPQAEQLDTAQVLTLAQQTSEVDEPFQVADGAVTLVPSDDETDDPMSID